MWYHPDGYGLLNSKKLTDIFSYKGILAYTDSVRPLNNRGEYVCVYDDLLVLGLTGNLDADL